jgi:hypothetical protein
MRGRKSGKLRFVDRILVHNLESGFAFSLQKSQKSGRWEAAWGDSSWPANAFAVERFYGELNDLFGKRKIGDNLSRCTHEVTIFSKNAPKNIKLNAEEAEAVLISANSSLSSGKISDDVALVGFLSSKIFSRVKDDCKIFKVKFDAGEFVFAKRNGRWFLDDLTAHLEVKCDLIANFLNEIFTLEAEGVCHSYDDPGQCNLSITLYGGNASERVDFLSSGEGLFFAENAAVDMFFFVEREKIFKIIDMARDLLKYQFFHALKCEDINVVLVASDEHFNFHDLKNQDKWQFTYSKKGKLLVREISKEYVNSMLEVLNQVESIGIVQDFYEEDKQFTITFSDGPDNSKTFNFYKVDEKLFVGIDGQGIKFEIKNSFCPMFFHILRSHAAKSEDVVL